MTTGQRLDKIERRKATYWDCQELLTYEKERSERHNHFFALCGVVFIDYPGADPIAFLKTELRNSDYIFSVPNKEGFSPLGVNVGLLLPETDLPGGQLVYERIKELCSARKFQVQVGLAIYPDDGTIPLDILKKAFSSVVSPEFGENSTAVKSEYQDSK